MSPGNQLPVRLVPLIVRLLGRGFDLVVIFLWLLTLYTCTIMLPYLYNLSYVRG